MKAKNKHTFALQYDLSRVCSKFRGNLHNFIDAVLADR